MGSEQIQETDDRLLAQRCQEGDRDALGELRERLHPTLQRILLARGASQTEVEDLLGDMWGDCVAGDDEKPSLLEKFSGKCSLQSWLTTVATNRLIDRKRRDKRRGDAGNVHGKDGETDFFERVEGPARAIVENELTALLRDSLQKGFAACPAEGLLMLRLVYLHGFSQREVATLWNCHEAKISRHLNQALERIEKETLAAVKAADPWLKLDWQDFIDLCQTHEVGFL
jgi:RNA polymerase sigma factor (sigma-70 family)